jgi:hypothetical protein
MVSEKMNELNGFNIAIIMQIYLEGEAVFLSDVSCQLDDSLHTLHLPFNIGIEVFFLYFREAQEMDRSGIACSWVFRYERT